MKTIKVGTAKSVPGHLRYGFIKTLDLPIGYSHQIPVMIAQGNKPGPTFFLTANVHGNELTGIAVIHDLVTDELAQELKGTVVAIPSLNPTGLRAYDRSPDFDPKDPNKLYPAGKFAKKEDEDEDTKFPVRYELVAKRIFAHMKKYADFHLDIHNHSLRSIPYSILDRIFYTNNVDKKKAEALAQQQKAMVEAFGVFYAVDFPAKKYLRVKYHRSVSGAVLNTLRKPAFTVELGSNNVLYPDIIAGSVKGVRNVLKWAGLLEGSFEPISEFPTMVSEQRYRRIEHPRTKHSGLIRFLVDPGDKVEEGQPIARITNLVGRAIGDGFIYTEHAGYMIALYSEIVKYENDVIAEMAILDDEDLFSPYP
ncbi:MAG: succinylglutamate desuccinylase/aspartoacylase family protein [Candidatus Hodarchaeota archaeon]